MKKSIFVLAVALLSGATLAMAQDRPQRGERPDPEKQMEQMIKDLGLDEKQATEFKAVMEQMRPAKAEMKQKKSETKKEKKEMKKKREEMKKQREEMEAKRKEMDEKIKTILTEEQYKKYQEMQKRRGPHGGPQGGPRGPRPDGPRPEGMPEGGFGGGEM